MRSNIEVKFLTPQEMANAKALDPRYENVKGTNLGFADKVKNRIFVRAGLDKELTKYLVDHELEHLFELEGTDEDENGIRHKGDSGGGGGGFWSWFLPVAGAVIGSILLPGAGTMLGMGGLGGLAGAMGASGLGAGLGNMAGSAIATGKPDWAGSIASGVGSGLGTGLGGLVGKMGASTAAKGVMGASLPQVGMTPGTMGQTASKGIGGLFGTAAGSVGNMLGSEGTKMALGMFSPRSSYGGAWDTRLRGFSDTVPQMSNMGRYVGMSGGMAPSDRLSGPVGGGVGIPSVGTGQAGISMGAQAPSAGMGQQMNPMDLIGFNRMNQGMLNFGRGF